MSETPILKRIQIAVAKLGVKIFRNNVGTLRDERGRYVSYGLCVGSSDLIGWFPTVVTPQMVGRKVAIFIAIEIKTETGVATFEQYQFIQAVNRDGGIGFIARSEGEAIDKVSKGATIQS